MFLSISSFYFCVVILQHCKLMQNTNTTFYNIGVSYLKADVQTRGRFSLTNENQVLLLEEAKKEGFEGVFVLSTCNRTEITGFAEHPFQLIKLLCKFSEGTVEEFAKYLYVNKGQEAIDHLFRMGTGLDSQILGDFEIISQVKNGLKLSKKHQMINPFMERLVNAVIQASKRINNETKISS